MFRRQQELYEEYEVLAKKAFPQISKKIRATIRDVAESGGTSIEFPIDSLHAEELHGNLYFQALQNLIESRFAQDGYIIDDFFIANNGNSYFMRSPTQHWAILQLSW